MPERPGPSLVAHAMTSDVIRRVLIVDDEPDVAHVLQRVLALQNDFEVLVESSAARALARIVDFEPQLVFTDLVMPEMGGADLLRRARLQGSVASFVVVSAYSTLENAVDAIKAGASDFLAKPFGPHDVDLVLTRIRRELSAQRDTFELRQKIAEQDPRLAQLLGHSAAMRSLRSWIVRAQAVSANVLIEGETGTGKELVARALHSGSGQFVAINVAAIPKDIAESELFGHRAGAFSGATRDRQGLFAEASGGTLFLDEINGMDLALQAKVLRALEDKAIRPVGGNREVTTSFRLIAATNEPLERLVEEGRFRLDLFHRLNVLHVRLPTLAERREDIPVLAREFLVRYASAHGRPARRFKAAALDWLSAQSWPGNVRQLENFVERITVFAPDDAVDLGVDAMYGGALRVRSSESAEAALFTDPRWTLDELERQYVKAVLVHTGGNKSRAAQMLDIDYKTLLRKLDPRRQDSVRRS